VVEEVTRTLRGRGAGAGSGRAGPASLSRAARALVRGAVSYAAASREEARLRADREARAVGEEDPALPGKWASREERFLAKILPQERGDAKDWAWMWGASLVMVWMSATMVQMYIHAMRVSGFL